jgi:hypothetical protein
MKVEKAGGSILIMLCGLTHAKVSGCDRSKGRKIFTFNQVLSEQEVGVLIVHQCF